MKDQKIQRLLGKTVNMALNSLGQPTFFTIPQPYYDKALATVIAAQTAWARMVQQFAAENIVMGITQAGKTGLIGGALNQVNVYGSTGSLWQAYEALNHVVITPEMAPFLTDDRIQWMRNQMIQAISSL